MCRGIILKITLKAFQVGITNHHLIKDKKFEKYNYPRLTFECEWKCT